jgi:hypothetical protein
MCSDDGGFGIDNNILKRQIIIMKTYTIDPDIITDWKY